MEDKMKELATKFTKTMAVIAPSIYITSLLLIVGNSDGYYRLYDVEIEVEKEIEICKCKDGWFSPVLADCKNFTLEEYYTTSQWNGWKTGWSDVLIRVPHGLTKHALEVVYHGNFNGDEQQRYLPNIIMFRDECNDDGFVAHFQLKPPKPPEIEKGPAWTEAFPLLKCFLY